MKNFQEKAQIFQILSHPVRLQILNELRNRESCVCHLQTVTQRPQAYISQQLRVLREAELVIDKKDGQNVYYHLLNDEVKRLLMETFGQVQPAVVLSNCTCPHCDSEST